MTSLPIYGLRNRAGPGSFCGHMANLHTGLAARAPPSSPWNGSQPVDTRRGLGLSAPIAAWTPGCRVQLEEGSVADPGAVAAGERAGREGSSVSWGGEEFRFAETFQKRRRSGSGGSASRPLFGSHSGKLNFGKKPSGAETLQSNPSFTFLAAQNRKQKKRQRKKKEEERKKEKKASRIHGS